MLRRRLVPLIAAVAAASVAVPLTATSAGAAPARAQSPQPAVHLALGDSVAAGVGRQVGDPAGLGYVELLSAQLQRPCGTGRALGCRLELVNIADPGETTPTLIRDQLPVALALLQERNSNATPVDDVRLITITVGGNDVINPIVAACIGGPTSPTCLPTVQSELLALAADQRAMLSALREAAGPRTTIAVMTYYNAFLPARCGTAAALPAVAALAPTILDGSPLSLNGVLRTVAAEHGAVVVDTADVVGPGQLAGDCLHPNAAGHAALADRFAEVLGSSVRNAGRG